MKAEDAEKFLEEFNGKEINEMPVSVERFVPFKDRDLKTQQNNVYIKNFPESFDKEKVEKFIEENFESLGDVENKGVFQDKSRNKYYAFVAYKDEATAKLAIETFNGDKVGEGEEGLFVGLAQARSMRRKLLKENFDQNDNKTNMYVRSLRKEVTEEQIKNVFGKYGEITSIFLKKWQSKPNANVPLVKPAKEMQFCFINYKEQESTNKLLSHYQHDEEILLLIDESNKKPNFVFPAQSKAMRAEFLKM